MLLQVISLIEKLSKKLEWKKGKKISLIVPTNLRLAELYEELVC